MSRTIFRGSRGGSRVPVRTATELSKCLKGPLWLVLMGKLRVVYPSSTRAHPSRKVGFRLVEEVSQEVRALVPRNLWISGQQWESVVVPMMSDNRLLRWSGTLPSSGSSVVLPSTAYAPGGGSVAETSAGTALEAGTTVGTTAFYQGEAVGNLYPDRSQFIEMVGKLLVEYAQAAGYP